MTMMISPPIFDNRSRCWRSAMPMLEALGTERHEDGGKAKREEEGREEHAASDVGRDHNRTAAAELLD